MSGILSQSTISLKWTYEVGGQTETSEAVSETIYTADPSAFTFSESVHGSEGGIGDYENATTLYDIVGLKKDGGSWKGVWIYGDDAESPFPDYREILKAENMEKYDMFRLSSSAGSFFIVFGETPMFSDVQQGAYYYDAVQWAVGREITTGTGENTFSPDMTCTTSQILTFLWRANSSPEPSVANPFTNVSDDAYYAKAAVWAHESGLVSGTVFDGDSRCTRLSTVIYLWTLAGKPSAASASFSDVPSDPDAVSAVSWAVENGITTGTGDNMFSPDVICSRGQIMTFLYRDGTK